MDLIRPEQTLFPQGTRGRYDYQYSFKNMVLSKDIDEKDHLFLAIKGSPDEYFDKRFRGKIKDDPEHYLFRKTQDGFNLEHPFPIACFATSNNSTSYVYARRDGVYAKDPIDVFIVKAKGKRPEKLFHFDQGSIARLSLDDQMKSLIFLVHDYAKHEHDVWLYNFETGTYRSLNVRQLIESELPIIIEKACREHPETCTPPSQ